MIDKLVTAISNWNIIGKGSLADQAVIDKDAQLKQQHEQSIKSQDVYIAELNTKTIPVIDAIHKMGRLTLSLLSLILGFIVAMYAINKGMSDVATISSIGGPSIGAAYSAVKGKGRPTN